jgi:hypothetical protein
MRRTHWTPETGQIEPRTKTGDKEKRNMDERAILDHQFTVAAYVVTWVIQLGYLAWLGAKWRAQKRSAAQHEKRAR